MRHVRSAKAARQRALMLLLISAGSPGLAMAGEDGLPSPTATATATIAVGGPQVLSVGGTGYKGKDQLTRAPAELVLSGASQGAVAATAGIRFPPDQVTLTSCQLEESLLVSHRLTFSMPQVDTIQVVVTARDVTQPSALLPSGVIVICPFTIPEELPPGFVLMEVVDPALTDADGRPLPVLTEEGGVDIRPFPRHSVACSIPPQGAGWDGWLILWVLPAIVLVTCRRSRAGACVFALVFLFPVSIAVGQPSTGKSSDGATETESTPETVEAHPPAEVPTELLDEDIEVITVTARKREELLEAVPMSISALPQETLRASGIDRFEQIAEFVPNLTFVTSPNLTEFNALIRGVGQLEEAEPGVGIYVDGVYLPRAGNSLLNVVDIQQIEVLRGPQGTLFGKNTIGGAINVSSVKPHDELEGSVLVRAGERDTVETRSSLNIPVPIDWWRDHLFTRFSLASANTEGYTKNQNPEINKRNNNRNALWFLGSVLFQPNDDLELQVSGNWFKDDSRSAGGRCTFVEQPSDPQIAFLLSSSFPQFRQKCEASRKFNFRSDISGVADPTDYGVWGNGTWNVGQLGFLDDAKVKLIGAWREESIRFQEDPDMTDDPIVVLSALGDGGDLDGDPREGRQISLEGQFHGRALDDKVVFVAGGFGQWEDRSQNTVTRALPGTLADYMGGTIIGGVEQHNWDMAFFGQTTYEPLDWLSLTAGVRYTVEHKDVSRTTINPLGTLRLRNVPEEIFDASADKTFDAPTPMASLAVFAPKTLREPVGLDYLMGYFTYSRGFKGGGFNQIAFSSRNEQDQLDSFDPEYLDSFEVGVKSIAFDSRLVMNLAGFVGLYDDIQVQQSVTIPNPNPGELPIVEIQTLNAAKATIYGMELDMQALPVSAARVMGSLGVLETEYDKFVGPSELDSTQEINRKGESFNDVPELKSHVAVDYAYPVGLTDWEWTNGFLVPRLDWYYQSEVHFLAPEVKQSFQDGYHLLDARLSYEFDKERASVSFYARNLTNEAYVGRVTSLVPFFGTLSRFYQPPRTLGVEISYRF